MPNVRFVKPELRDMLKDYELVDDCLAGERRVKYRKTLYLPQPNAADTSAENAARYEAYRTRAVFYNVTARTAAGLTGAVFESPPAAKLPTALQPVIDDASGGGVSLEQMAKALVTAVLAKGRSFLWVDFPQAPEGGASRADVEAGLFRPAIEMYKAQQVINWRTKKVGGKTLLTLVVIQREYVVDDDEFEEKKRTEWVVLRLRNDVYTVEYWRSEMAGGTARPAEGPYTPTDANGKPFTEIPGIFVGSENNDPDIDRPPMYDMASLNIGHYRNSADFEEAAYIVGQPTPWFSGLTETWVKNVLAGRVELGSRAAVPLPENGAAGLLQATETTLAFSAMEHKERQMVALGARLVQNEGTQRTATEARMEDASETSVLSTVANNCSDAIEWILGKAMMFINGSETETIEYRLNTRYGLSELSPEELNAVLAAWTGRAIDFEEMRDRLVAGGLAKKTATEAKASIDGEIKEADDREVAKATATAEGAAAAASKFPKPAPRA